MGIAEENVGATRPVEGGPRTDRHRAVDVGTQATLEPAYPNLDVGQEVRLAVVMYGGVSLAIYMNGIAEELYHLVRSTAVDRTNADMPRALLAECDEESCTNVDHLKGTEVVYRKLGQILRRGRLPGPLNQRQPNNPISTRFVVDILSGTSAGGINAIYLAKALANDEPFEHLKKLWIEEGDIARLINDKESVKDLGPNAVVPGQPQSLLNSDRMYLKLFQALQGMNDRSKGTDSRPPGLVDDVDLYVTTTDIRGVPVPLQLNERISERRHRHAFHFRYANRRCATHFALGGPEAGGGPSVCRCPNDFVADNDPYLAFVARCTSAFPFAFEPMSEEKLKELAGLDDRDERWEHWQAFGPADLSTNDDERRRRAYGDGGYLDNKPFSYAIDAVARRESGLPVDRKLIYIEPSPEHPEQVRQPRKQPNVVENVTAALSLARYETIREDLQRVMDNNRLIEKVNRLTRKIEHDLDDQLSRGRTPPEPFRSHEWPKKDLADMIERWGIPYAAYYHVRVAEITDEVARYISAGAGFEERTVLYEMVRHLVRVWRDENYTEFLNDAPEKLTQNRLLQRFDISYRLRRLRYLQHKIDDLLLLAEVFPNWVTTSTYEASRADARTRASVPGAGLMWSVDAAFERTLSEGLRGWKPTAGVDEDVWLAYWMEFDADDFQHELRRLRTELENIERELVGTRDRLLSLARPGRQIHPLRDAIEQARISESELRNLVADTDLDPINVAAASRAGGSNDRFGSALASRARVFLMGPHSGDRAKRLERLANAIENEVALVTKPASARVKEMLSPENWSGALTSAQRAARVSLWDTFKNYDYFDMAAFPVLYSTGVGEADRVEVLRISPEAGGARGAARAEAQSAQRKLAGTALFHFGAMLDERWRRNDILWGRLDGAEQLIAALIPGSDDVSRRMCGELKAEAHRAIIEEELLPSDKMEVRQHLVRLLGETLKRPGAAEDLDQVIRDMVEETLGPTVDSRIVETLRSFLTPDEITRLLHSDRFEVHPHQPDPHQIARTLARGTQVVGKMIEGLAPNDASKAYTAWIARVGAAAWGLVEVAVPGSFPNVMFRYWRNLILMFGLLMVLLAAVTGEARMLTSGLTILGVVLLASAAQSAVGDYLKRPSRRPTAWLLAQGLMVVFFVVAVVLVVLLVVRGVPVIVRDLLAWASAPKLEAIGLQGVGALALVGSLSVIVPWICRHFPTAASSGATSVSTLPNRLSSPSFAIEFAGTGANVRAIAGGSAFDARRGRIEDATGLDFGFIVLYLVLFVALATLIFLGGGSTQEGSTQQIGGLWVQQGLGVAIGALGLCAGIFDAAENVNILRLMRVSVVDRPHRSGDRPDKPVGPPRFDSDMLAASVRRWAFLKWLCTFLAVASTGAALFWLGGGGRLLDSGPTAEFRLAPLVLGGLTTAAAVAGLLGLVWLRFRQDGRALEVAFGSTMMCLGVFGLWLVMRPAWAAGWLGIPLSMP